MISEFYPSFQWTNLLIIPGLLLGYTVHELAHAFAAYFLGDYSQVEEGRITLNPMRHIAWFGALAFILFGVGWPNPMEVNPRNFKRNHLDVCLAAIAGPLASFFLCLVVLLLTLFMAAILFYSSNASWDTILLFLFPIPSDLPESFNLRAFAMSLTSYMAIASFWLTLTSLLPLPGMDGFVIIVSLMAYFKSKNEEDDQEQPIEASTANVTTPVNAYKRRNNVSDIHFKLGAQYHQSSQFDDAIARYRQAISNDQQFGPAYVNLGLAYMGKGKRREAIHAFRGAVQYADDQKSQQEAWHQLHQLSEVSPLGANAVDSLHEMGASPWTDTKPRPNWLNLGISSGLLLLCGLILYGYLVSSLIDMLKA